MVSPFPPIRALVAVSLASLVVGPLASAAAVRAQMQ